MPSGKFQLKVLHPRNPPNREPQIPQHLALQIQLEILVLFELVPGNARCDVFVFEYITSNVFRNARVFEECEMSCISGG